MTTAHGGFYINTGSLEFKTNEKAVFDLSSDDSESDAKVKKPKKEEKKKLICKVNLKKAKIINTNVKTGVKKARIINTEKKKPGPKQKSKVDPPEKTVVKKPIETNEEKTAAKPPEIIDLEAQLEALSGGGVSDQTKAEYLGVKITKVLSPGQKPPVANGSTSTIQTQAPKPTLAPTKPAPVPVEPAVVSAIAKPTTVPTKPTTASTKSM